MPNVATKRLRHVDYRLEALIPGRIGAYAIRHEPDTNQLFIIDRYGREMSLETWRANN